MKLPKLLVGLVALGAAFGVHRLSDGPIGGEIAAPSHRAPEDRPVGRNLFRGAGPGEGDAKALRSLIAGQSREEWRARAEALWSRKGDSPRERERQIRFARAWGALDGEAAVEFVFGRESAAKLSALGGALAGWAETDVNGVAEWIDSRESSAERILFRGAMIEGWAGQDPEGAMQYLLEQDDLAGRDRLVRVVALEQVRRNPEAAALWAAELPAGSLKNTAIEEVALRWSRIDPEAAVRWSTGAHDLAEYNRAVDVSMTEWAGRDHTAAAEFLQENWLEAPAWDRASAGFVRVLSAEDLESVAAWASLIRDTALRSKALLRIVREWSIIDPNRLVAWAAASGYLAEPIDRSR